MSLPARLALPQLRRALAGPAFDPEDAALKDPSRSDVLLAIWSALALTEDYDDFLGTDLGEEALMELFGDLQADLAATDLLLDDEFEDWAIATG